MRNFTGNPFLMVSERSGHAKLVKTSKNKFLAKSPIFWKWILIWSLDEPDTPL